MKHPAVELERIGYEALKVSVMASKLKKVRNLASFFNGVLNRFVFEEQARVLAKINAKSIFTHL